MTVPADSLPGDHLRAEELHEGKKALCRFMREHSAPPISDDTVLSLKLEECLCVSAAGSVCLNTGELHGIKEDLCMALHLHVPTSQSFLERFAERLSILSRSTYSRMIAACCILLILGNSVALAASETIPGDTLYPVKVKVLEPARAIVIVTPEGKAQWASTCIRRRLVEAERLIAQDRLTPEAWGALNTSIAANAKVAERHITRLSKSDASEAAELSADLHLAVNAHGQVFSDIVQQDTTDDVIAVAAADLSSVAADTGRLYEETEAAAWKDESETEAVATRVMQSASSAAFQLAEMDVQEVRRIPEQAKERGEKAREFLKSAQDRFNDGKFHESLRDARMAAQKAEEGNTFIRMGFTFDADEDSSANTSLMAVPVTVCGATTVKIGIPAIMATSAVSQPSSLSNNHTKSSSSSSRSSSVSSIASEASSSSVSSSISLSSSSTTSVASISSGISSTSSEAVSSVESVASSSLSIGLPPIIPDIPLLH